MTHYLIEWYAKIRHCFDELLPQHKHLLLYFKNTFNLFVIFICNDSLLIPNIT